VSIYDRWHKTHPDPGDEPCPEHSRGRTKLYPTTDHGIGGRWQVRWRDETGHQRKRNFAKRDGIDPEKRLDFLRREVDIAQQLVCVTGQDPYLGPPKTKTSARTVELPAITVAALARHIEMFPPVEVEIWDRTNPDRRKHHRRQARLMFTSIAGRPIHRATWTYMGTSGPEGEHPERYGHPLLEALLRHTADPQRGKRQARAARPRPLHAHHHSQHVCGGVA